MARQGMLQERPVYFVAGCEREEEEALESHCPLEEFTPVTSDLLLGPTSQGSTAFHSVMAGNEPLTRMGLWGTFHIPVVAVTVGGHSVSQEDPQ